MSKAPRPDEPEVQSITAVPESLDDDQARRTKVYLIQMGIRLVCFVAAILCLTAGPAWLGWTLAVGAVVLPYTAVVFVNAGPNRTPRDAQSYVPQGPAALPESEEPGKTGTGPAVIDGDALLEDVRDEPVEKKN
ncbi:DUF3099 domain-containing protein [Myceligenerans xiligouense]|uniref:DUF3099 family protein n=1 Tax=Myceligenerans xiligouense TaxID=253184 RepID=A0A3N4YT73_9MICO|nr:DUF3099 domain-containing protein [Myceligenerans xiligouense]RPF21780.1 DUF3099 family protein [Myceligenerans xiligouense]